MVTSDADTGGKVSLALHLDNVQHHPVTGDSTRTSDTWSDAARGMPGDLQICLRPAPQISPDSFKTQVVQIEMVDLPF